MKIQKKSSKKFVKILAVILAVMLIGALIWHFQFSSTGQTDDDSTDQQDNSRDFEDSRESTLDNEVNTSPEPTPDETSPRDTQQPESPGFISSPITNPPATNDPYPIENEHYKIEQQSERSYQITLYPIANNPEYSDYNAQLKAYKTEALDYLTKRYGNIDNFTFTWSPSDAQNI